MRGQEPIPLNYIAEERYRPAYRPETNYHQAFMPLMAMTASSAVAIVHQPVAVYDPRTHRTVPR